MTNCVVVFDGRVARVIYDDTRQYCRTVVSNLWVATPLVVALIFSGVAVTRHMFAVLV